jgi:acyl-CoA dehydrogenase
MEALLLAVLSITLLGATAYFKAPALLISALLAVLFSGFYFFIGMSVLQLVPAAVALIIGLVAIAPVRRHLVSSALLRQFRRVMPPISDTEREALESGTVGWEAELFSGRPQWSKLLDQPKPQLTARERAFIDGPVEELCGMLDDWRITHEEQDLPLEIWSFIKESRMFGMIIPQRYGGLEFSALAHSTVVMKLASRSIVAAVTVMVPNSLGPAKLLLHYGTEEQKDFYLPRLARGEEIPCFALTGPDAGSDAGAMPDRGIVSYGEFQGERILGIRLNWEKRYITLGPVSTLIGLAFQLEDPDGLLDEGINPGITVALIPRDTPGVHIGQRHIPLDIPFQNGPNWGEDVFIPLEWVIGGVRGVGQGWRMLMESLAEGRGISLPALATGAGKVAARYTGAYARIRRQFNQPIGYFEGVEEALARIAGATYEMDAARRLTLAALDKGEKPAISSAIIKYHLTERYRQVINDAMDIQGGSGICLGPNNLIGRAYQAIPIAITVEGANILTRSMIIFGQGAIRSHPFLLREINAVQETNEERALHEFDRAIVGHAGFLLRNILRTPLLGISRGRFSRRQLSGHMGRNLQYLNWMSSAFALTADTALMTLGGSLKRRERLSARLGDILSDLYILSAVLKHYLDQGQHSEDLPLVRRAFSSGLHRIQQALGALFQNLPFRPLAWLLRLLVFPSGMPFRVADDQVDREVARILLAPSAARDRLTRHLYVTINEQERVGQLEMALEQADRVAAVERSLRKARRSGVIGGNHADELAVAAVAEGVITQEQKEELERMAELRRKVIAVDQFHDYGKEKRSAGPFQQKADAA